MQRKHITRIAATCLLAVFSVLVFPWSLTHRHAEISSAEKNCRHKAHVELQADNCVLCHVHFEKNFTLSRPSDWIISVIKFDYTEPPLSRERYTRIKATCLRGPPCRS
ncbi:hypothetical protein [Pedobacter yulinensis]|nr:hypothetical protein [Pedobacter yulinensis]